MEKQLNAYFSDTYLFEAEATVIATGHDDGGEPWIAVSPNIFHPRGGGQMEDTGTVDGREVAVGRLDDGLVVLTGAGDPAVGSVVRTAVDPDTRLLHAALHTAGHLVGFLGEERGWRHSGHSHFPGQARLDFHPESVSEDLVAPQAREQVITEIQGRLEALVATKATVASSLDEAGIRTVVIGGVNAEPCGGTHVRDLGALRGTRVMEAKIKRGALKVRYEATHG
ncbi:hypothetical protein ACIPVK_19885 [Paeniglutamicibacter sp. MACA_103]|uniref:hypothetical protein n=1 Tax=Paeniglutamicibacter sp. MACA_103 TaxID=3377337 RepID=UPI0038957144